MRQNKDLFSSKREFLTKLREVRQKYMNNKTKDGVGQETPEYLETQMLEDCEDEEYAYESNTDENSNEENNQSNLVEEQEEDKTEISTASLI